MMIYMDNAATTQMRREVVEVMLPYMTVEYGNPSANYEFATKVKQVIERAREEIAQTIHCDSEEIYFTSGGTESDNWALKSLGRRGKHVITSKIEHHAVLNACKKIEKDGCKVSYVDVNQEGMVDLNQLEKSIYPQTTLISIMAANNEIGTIEPIFEIGKIAQKHHILFHTDAVQAYTNMNLNVKEMPIDLLSVSAHKFNGPKGTGFLYMKKDISIEPFMDGGAQENGMRAGTENVSGIVGMAKAAVIAHSRMEKKINKEIEIRDYMIERVMREIPYARLNGGKEHRLPNNMNFSFQYVDGGTLIAMLDHQNICASAGSACTSTSKEPSHVLKAIGLSDEMAHGAVRLTISENTSFQEADYVINCLKYDVKKLQFMY